jgi:hypothetical protein
MWVAALANTARDDRQGPKHIIYREGCMLNTASLIFYVLGTAVLEEQSIPLHGAERSIHETVSPQPMFW